MKRVPAAVMAELPVIAGLDRRVRRREPGARTAARIRISHAGSLQSLSPATATIGMPQTNVSGDTRGQRDDTLVRMIRTDLWHGGAPGRAVGDLLLPPNVTDLLRTSAVLSVESGLSRLAHRRDRVYLAAGRELARV